MDRKANRKAMIRLVKQWQESGLSQREFAINNNLSFYQFKYWIYKCRKNEVPKESESAFIKLNDFTGTSNISIRYPNGVEVTLPEHSSLATIKSLINI